MDLNTPMKGEVSLVGSCEYSTKQGIETILLHNTSFYF